MKPRFKDKRNYVILVQDRVSHSSKDQLRPALRCRRITPLSVGVRPVPAQATIINFGGGALPVRPRHDSRILNPPDRVARSANKLETFRLLTKAQVPTVRWTSDREEANKWMARGFPVLCRRQLASSGGRGIRVAYNPDQLVPAPLYTRYFAKTHEFRVHVVNGKAIDIVEKKLRENLRGHRQDRSTIRNHRNGWVFAHTNLAVSRDADLKALGELGVSACVALGLDFGAVDVLAILESPVLAGGPRILRRAVVCEVNSAPGIENTQTRDAYVKAFNQMIEVA